MKLVTVSILASLFFFATCLFSISSIGLFHSSFTALDLFAQQVATQVNSPAITLAMIIFTYLGNWQTILALCAVVIMVLILWRGHLSHERFDIIVFLTSIFIGFGLALIFKMTIGRARPDIHYVGSAFLGNDSFPSAHALMATVLYGLIVHAFYHISKTYRQKVLVVGTATLIVVLIGISRVYLNLHWFSDVLAGWFLGIVILAFFIALFDRFEYTVEQSLKT